MPRYFFHVRRGGLTVFDREGGRPRCTDRPINSGAISCSPIPTPTTFLSKDTGAEQDSQPVFLRNGPTVQGMD
jgi:hypothetical protein